MKKSLVIALTLCVAGLVAFAADGEKKDKKADKVRAKVLEKYDKNANGKLDDDEREAAKADRRKAAEDKKPADEKKD